MRFTPTAVPTSMWAAAICAVTLTGCGGGGGGGDAPALSLTFEPAELEATLYTGNPADLFVLASVGGTVQGVVDVVIRDDVGVIAPTVDILQIDQREYEVTLRTADELAAGRHQGHLTVTLCGAPSCSPVYARKQLPYDLTVLDSPAIDTLSPALVMSGSGAFTLRVTGSHFSPGSSILWNGGPRTTTYVSASELTTPVAAEDVQAGRLVNVAVLAPSGLAESNPVVLEVRNPVPVLTSLDPGRVLPGSDGQYVGLRGSGFTPSSRILVDGVVGSMSFASSDEIYAYFYTNELAVGRILNISVESPPPGGGTTGTLPFAIANATPVVSSITPSRALVGDGAVAVQIAGTGFQTNSVVRVNGAFRAASYSSPTLMTIDLPPTDFASAGTLAITVTNPPFGGGTSAPVNFAVDYPVPVLAAVDPSLTTAGCAGMTLAASGSGFQPTSLIEVDGAARPTTFVSASRLTTPISAAELATAGSLAVTVSTGPPGGGTSESRALDIQASGPPTSSAVAWRQDEHSSGTATLRCPTAVPQAPAWAYDIGSPVGGVLIVEGRVLVSSTGLASTGRVAALDAATGNVLWGPVEIPGSVRMGYAGGQLILTREVGDPEPAQTFMALDPGTGNVLWSEEIGGIHSTNSPPVSADGLVFAHVAGATRALDAATGAPVWFRTTVSYTVDVPLVAAGAVITSEVCDTWASEAATGAPRWRYNHGCSSGGGRRLALSDGATVYSADGGTYTRIDAVTGVGGGFLSSGHLPSLRDGVAFVTVRDDQFSPYQLRQIDLRPGGTIANYATPPITSPPVLVNRSLVAQTSGTTSLVGVDIDTGGVQWTIPATSAPLADIYDFPVYFGPIVGEGWLIVRTTGGIAAFRIGE